MSDLYNKIMQVLPFNLNRLIRSVLLLCLLGYPFSLGSNVIDITMNSTFCFSQLYREIEENFKCHVEIPLSIT